MVDLDSSFQFLASIHEEHRPQQIYCVKFCDILLDYFSYFASVGGNSSSVYVIDEGNQIKLIQSYIDEDVEEIFYTCCWAQNNDAEPLLLLAGFRGIIKSINCSTFELESFLLGHGNAINDLKLHPVDENLIFSASKDESIRLWNLKTTVCIAIFAGVLKKKRPLILIFNCSIIFSSVHSSKI
jgi:polycomb protein EED